jgi:uncharacterized metal-binding protein
MCAEKSDVCCGGPTLIFACSGAADVGEIADRTARKLTKDGFGKMFCLAGIGGHVSGIMKTTESASKILAIDGCTLNCVKNCFQQAGFNKFVHLQLADIGLEKGKSPATNENIDRVIQKAVELLN